MTVTNRVGKRLWNFLALILVLALVGMVCLPMFAQHMSASKPRVHKSTTGLSSLPPGAQRAIWAVLEKDDPDWAQQAELIASDGLANDDFGNSVAISGSRVVVGAPDHTVGSHQYQGAAYVFVENGGAWSQQAELVASDGVSLDGFGSSVAVSGSTVVVGATKYYNGGPGAAYVFVQNANGTWSQQAELKAPYNAQSPNDEFGDSVAVDGSTVVVGAPFSTVGSIPDQDQGASYVFVENGGTWSQQAELTASDGAPGDHLGFSIALSGGTAVVGAPCHPSQDWMCESPGPGAAYSFVRSGGTWSQQAELTPSDGKAWDEFGQSVAVSGSTAVVGAPCHPAPTGWPCNHSPGPGAAYVFAESGGTWGQRAELKVAQPTALEDFGWTVAISGGTTVIGALEQTVGSNLYQGVAYVYAESGGAWSQKAELSASDGKAWDEFGDSVSVDGSTVAVAASCHPASYPNCGPGAAYVFGSPTTMLSPSSLSFGNQAIHTSTAKTVTLTNTGTATLDITSVSITRSANPFTISINTCGATLDAGKKCTVKVTFTPTALSAVTGTLSFTDNAAGSPQTVSLSGTGEPQANLTPASDTFPTTKVGTKSASQNFTLKNNLPTTLTGITYSTAAPFAVSRTTCGTTLAGEKSCTISVTFSPTTTGKATGTLTVHDSANNGRQTASLSGTGD